MTKIDHQEVELNFSFFFRTFLIFSQGVKISISSVTRLVHF